MDVAEASQAAERAGRDVEGAGAKQGLEAQMGSPGSGHMQVSYEKASRGMSNVLRFVFKRPSGHCGERTGGAGDDGHLDQKGIIEMDRCREVHSDPRGREDGTGG